MLEGEATNRHHIYWPRARYSSKLERKFRNLPCNVVRLAVSAHVALHRITQPPEKPTPDFMRARIDAHKAGRCECGR